jgi:hypothetical protein
VAELTTEELRIISGYQEQVDAVRTRTEEVAAASWRALPDHNEGTIDRWIVTILGILTGAQIVTSALTDRYLAAVGTAIGGVAVRPIGVPSSVYDLEIMRGVAPELIYRRPAQTMWRTLGDGSARDTAIAAGLVRLLELLSTDLQLTKTHTARYVGGRSALIVGYRRVLSGRPCSLCSSKNTKFSSHELMAIHPRCHCSMLPIYKGRGDPGPIEVKPIDDRGSAAVHLHGEIGPMLTARGDAFASAR